MKSAYQVKIFYLSQIFVPPFCLDFTQPHLPNLRKLLEPRARCAHAYHVDNQVGFFPSHMNSYNILHWWAEHFSSNACHASLSTFLILSLTSHAHPKGHLLLSSESWRRNTCLQSIGTCGSSVTCCVTQIWTFFPTIAKDTVFWSLKVNSLR